jgi:putative metalloprotease
MATSSDAGEESSMGWTWGLALIVVVTLSGCSGGGSLASVDVGTALGAAADLGRAATVTDDEVKAYAKQMRDYEEKSAVKVAPASSKYSKRLARLTNNYRDYDGMKLNFKVYDGKEVNANATADGSIRVYTGLMDLMNDDELLFVIGHVKDGHSAKAMRTALAASGVRKAAAASGGGAVSMLAASELGALAEAVLNAQYSQSQETEADDYGLAFLKKNHLKVGGAVTSLRKLAQGSASSGYSILSTHPDPTQRADRLAKMTQSG